MKRGRWHGRPLVVGALIVLATVTATAGASGRVSVDVVTNAALRTKIIVDAGGFTLYHLTREKKGAIDCTGLCSAAWVPLLAGSAKPVAGAGLSASKLSTIKRPAGGGLQVTYNNYALYLYRGDKKAGQVNGQGSGGDWYAITPSGAITKQTATVTTTTPASGTTTSGPSGSSLTSGSSGSLGTSGSSGASAAGPTDPACAPGQTIDQNGDGVGTPLNDDDTDNEGGETDSDGCL